MIECMSIVEVPVFVGAISEKLTDPPDTRTCTPTRFGSASTVVIVPSELATVTSVPFGAVVIAAIDVIVEPLASRGGTVAGVIVPTEASGCISMPATVQWPLKIVSSLCENVRFSRPLLRIEKDVETGEGAVDGP